MSVLGGGWGESGMDVKLCFFVVVSFVGGICFRVCFFISEMDSVRFEVFSGFRILVF